LIEAQQVNGQFFIVGKLYKKSRKGFFVRWVWAYDTGRERRPLLAFVIFHRFGDFSLDLFNPCFGGGVG